MDSPQKFPAREAEVREESTKSDRPEQQEVRPLGSTEPSRNGKPSLSSLSTELPGTPVTGSQAHSAPSRHPVFSIAFIVLALYLGVVVVLLPWRDAWTENSLLDFYPALRSVLTNNFVRGLVSGIGVLDIWAAISEALSFRRHSSSEN